MLSWAQIGLAGSFGALLVVVARAVSRKTHIYFIVELDISHSIVALVISAQVGFFTFKASSYHKNIEEPKAQLLPVLYVKQIEGRWNGSRGGNK